MRKLKKISLVVMIIFYLVAGFNHFYNPPSYLKIIPDYIPFPKIINLAAGFFELWFAIMLLFAKTRKLAAWGIILMLIAFLPVHIQMVKDAPFVLGGSITVTPFIAWVRLVVLQPLLILWAWWYTKDKSLNW
jgi:uncharacterized membrane protein